MELSGRDKRLWFVTTPGGKNGQYSRSSATLPGGASTPIRRTLLSMVPTLLFRPDSWSIAIS
jgi:hypothetical protein